MVMEYAAGGELYDYINDDKVTPTEAKRLFRQIASAVQYLHKVRPWMHECSLVSW